MARTTLPQRLADETIRSVPSEYDYPAPDGSEIRLLVSGEHGGFAHCVLPAGKTSSAVRHRTVEELWYVLEGTGQIWRAREGEPSRLDALRPGDSLRIPAGTAFQFPAGVGMDLKLLIATMPPWPGEHEAVAANGGFASVRENAGRRLHRFVGVMRPGRPRYLIEGRHWVGR